MGTWGSGNFESDDAGEVLDRVVERLVKEIVYALAPQNRNELPVYLGQKMMAAIEMLVGLDEHCDALPFYVYPRLVRYWRDTYLSAYDEKVEEGITSPESVVKRRQVIVDTFSRLEAASLENTKHSDDDDGVPLP